MIPRRAQGLRPERCAAGPVTRHPAAWRGGGPTSDTRRGTFGGHQVALHRESNGPSLERARIEFRAAHCESEWSETPMQRAVLLRRLALAVFETANQVLGVEGGGMIEVEGVDGAGDRVIVRRAFGGRARCE
jgi:hypothetical protein